MSWLWEEFAAWVADNVNSAFDLVFHLLTLLLFAPQVYELPQVRQFQETSYAVVGAGYVLAIIACGIVVMTRGTIQHTYGASELIPRLVLGLVASFFAGPIVQMAIDATNALRMALTSESIATEGSRPDSLDRLRELLPGPSAWELFDLKALVFAVILLIIVVLIFMIVIGWLVRLAGLIILAGLGPLALVAHATPWTDPVAQLWWRMLLAVLAPVVLQSFALHTGVTVLLDPDASLAAMGMPDGDLVDLLVFLVILLLTARIPGMVAGYLNSGGGRSQFGWFVMWLASHGPRSGGRRGATGGTSGPSPPRNPRSRRRRGKDDSDDSGDSGDSNEDTAAPSRRRGPMPGTRLPRPNRPPKFSNRTRTHKPKPMPKNLKPEVVFSHPDPPDKPIQTPATARAQVAFDDGAWQPPYPADGSHPPWKPVARPATLKPTVEFKAPPEPAGRAEAESFTPPNNVDPVVRFSHPDPPPDQPRSTPPRDLQPEPLFSHGGWRRGGQPVMPPRPASGGGTQGDAARWPSVAVYGPRSRPARPQPGRTPDPDPDPNISRRGEQQ